MSPSVDMKPGPEPASSTVWRFGDFELHVERALWRSGRVLPLGRRALSLLGVLVAAQGRLVTRQELIDAVWPHTVVVENALHQHLRLLRVALADAAALVQTVGRQGYRFAGAAERVESAAEPAAPGPWPVLAAPVFPAWQLPAALTPLVGREAACATLQTLLAQVRCITLVGPGGVGKTRLALAAAQALVQADAGLRAVWVELAALQDEEAVPPALAAALGVMAPPGRPPLQSVQLALGSAPALLVLDNCEHLHERCAAVASQLLRELPALRVLATSQCPLGLPGERVLRVPPLELPAEGASQSAGGAGHERAAALRLLVDRVADAVGAPIELTASALDDAAALCRRLDGNPLALEMAAVRVAALGWAATRAGLSQHLDLLQGARHDGLPRQRSLQALLDWSHDLLPPPLQRLWRRLAVFRGGFTLQAAVSVAGQGDAALDTDSVLAGLAQLIDRSLVQADTASDADEPRYGMAEVPRVIALQRLQAAGEHEAVCRRHAEHQARLFEAAAGLWEHQADDSWLRAHAPERDNLSAAIAFALDQGDRVLAARLVGASTALWRAMSALHELRRVVDHPLLQAPDAEESPGRAENPLEARLALARAFSLLGESAATAQLMRAATDAAQRCLATGDRLATAQAWLCVASASARQGDLQAQTHALDRAEALLGGHAPGKTYGWLCDARAWQLQLDDGDLAASLQWARTARDVCAHVGALLGETQALLHMADLQLALGDVAGALAVGELLEQRLRDSVHAELRGRARANLGAACSAAGQAERARRHLLQALADLRGLDFSYWVFDHLAPLALAQGQPELAARMLGHADAGYARYREGRRLHNEAASYRATLARLGAQMAPPVLACLLAGGAHDDESVLVARFSQAA